MNDYNLIPNSQRTREELQEMGRRGGIASGRIRRRKRDLKAIVRAIAPAYDIVFASVADVCGEMGIEHSAGAVWLLVELLDRLSKEQRAGELLDPDKLRSMGLRDDVAGELLQHWKRDKSIKILEDND